MDDTTADAIRDTLKQIISDIAPTARFVPKYGGEVIAPDPESDTHFVGGLFQYADHVTMEFSKGATFDDPANLLQGKGKLRRHLKFTCKDDIAENDIVPLVEQAFAAG